MTPTPEECQVPRASRTRSTSRSRPTTPLRPSSRTSFRSSARGSTSGPASDFPLNAFEPAFAELADAMADLEANLHHFQVMHESVKRFGESFAAFLYGLEVNAFCVDFVEAPLRESWGLAAAREELRETLGGMDMGMREGGAAAGILEERGMKTPGTVEETFMTTDVSFVENPSTAPKTTKFATPAPKGKTAESRPSRMPAPTGRGRAGTSAATRGRTGRTTRGTSGIARASGTSRASSTRGRGVAR